MKKTIKIEVQGGLVADIHNLPEGYDYEIIDHDVTDEEGKKKLKKQLKELEDEKDEDNNSE